MNPTTLNKWIVLFYYFSLNKSLLIYQLVIKLILKWPMTYILLIQEYPNSVWIIYTFKNELFWDVFDTELAVIHSLSIHRSLSFLKNGHKALGLGFLSLVTWSRGNFGSLSFYTLVLEIKTLLVLNNDQDKTLLNVS